MHVHTHTVKGFFTVSHSFPLTLPTAVDLQFWLALLFSSCVWHGLCLQICLVVLFVWCVVLVSAGRNVLDSVPPTHRPPTHGRLCIYTSGSSRSPQSLCSFKSLPSIYPSAPVLYHWLFRRVFLLQPNRHTKTHAHTLAAFHDAHSAFNKNNCGVRVCTQNDHTHSQRGSVSVEKRLQSCFLI